MTQIGLRGRVVRSPEQHSEQRRKILIAAGRVFARKGYSAATMDEVAAEMGVTKGVLYYQFKSKQDVIVETCRETSGRAADRLEEIVGLAVPVAERMELAIRDLISASFDELAYHMILMPATRALDKERAAEVRSIERRYERLLITLLETGIAEGSFLKTNVKLTAFTLIQACLSAALWYRDGGPLGHQEIVDGITTQLMRGISV